jgi:inorganic pyrophosphatase
MEKKFSCQALIEIPQGSSIKYEWDFDLKILHAVRSLPENYVFPVNYGFIPKTLAPDEDELDIFVFSSAPIIAPSLVHVQVVGVLEMTDKGVRDDKIISYMQGDVHWKLKESIEKWPSALIDQLHSFYREVKRLEKKPFEFLGFKNAETAISSIKNCALNFEEKIIRR